MRPISNISFSPALCVPVREAMRTDALSASEENEVYRLYHALRQVRSSSVNAPNAGLMQTDRGFAGNLLVHGLRAITAFWGKRVIGKYIEASLPSASLAIQHHIDPTRYDQAHRAGNGGLFPHFRDPLVFPSAAAEPIYASRPVEVLGADIHFFSVNSRAGRVLLALFNDEDGDILSSELPKHLENKELLLVFMPHALNKRAALGQTPVSVTGSLIESTDPQQRLDESCMIRTKTNAGNIVGDSLLVAGEYVRNPLRGVAEKIKEKLLPGHPMTEMEVTMGEMSNVAQDIILGIWTIGVYPILKYGAAKALTTLGHGVNGDQRCLKREFSGEEMAQLLFNTEIGITNRLMSQRVPARMSHAKEFKPDGLFVQEHLPSGIHTEKYMTIQRNGLEIMIREKSPGEFVTYHPHATHGERLEQRVFFDQKKQRIFFERQLPEDSGYDFDIVDGRKYISLYGKNRELVYNAKTRRPEIKIESAGKSEILPVYMEKLSHAWHLHERGGRPVFSAKQEKLINRIRLGEPREHVYRATENLNVKTYGCGKIYEARLPGKFMSESPALHAVEMNGELLPVRLKVMPEHGVRYEAYNAALPGKTGYPIEWDGARWVFERATSRQVAKSLKNAVKKEMFDQITAEHLSAPDDNGIRWDRKDRGFLKIKNGFIQLHRHRYHPDAFLVRQGPRNIHVIWKNHQFHLETLAQRLQKLRTIGLSGRSPGQNMQSGIMRKRTAAHIIADVYNTDVQGAHKILREYRFPAHGMFNEMEFALHLEAYQSVPPWAQRLKIGQPGVTNPSIALGDNISDGAYGEIYLDKASDHFLIKKYKNRGRTDELAKQRAMAQDEADLFSKYYGPETSCVIIQGDTIYLRMYKVPGKTLNELVPPGNIEQPIFPEDACERYVDMLEHMLDVDIIHKDLHMDNILYDSTSMQFYPIDFSNHRTSFFSLTPQDKKIINDNEARRWRQIMNTIRSLKKESADELFKLNQIPFTQAERKLVQHGFWLDDITRVRGIGGLTYMETSLITQQGKTLDDIVRMRENLAPRAQN